MTKHITGTRDEWLAARLELLDAEKDLTRRADELAKRRQELPWVRLDKPYRFETDEGSASLGDLFRGRSQLLVYHFMFGPDYKAGCPSCSAIADGFNGSVVHLANHDVTLMAVSRAPLAKLQEYKRRMGWTFPWASSSPQRLQRRLRRLVHRGAAARRPHLQLPAREAGRRRPGRQRQGAGRALRGDDWHGCRDLHARAAGHERVRARGRRRLPHLFRVFARRRWHLGHVPVARPRAARTQRARPLVAAPRRVPGLRVVMERTFLGVSALLFAASVGSDDRVVHVDVGHGRDADARRLDDVDDVDADAGPDVARRRGLVPRHVDRDDGGDDAAGPAPGAAALSRGRSPDGRGTPRPG